MISQFHRPVFFSFAPARSLARSRKHSPFGIHSSSLSVFTQRFFLRVHVKLALRCFSIYSLSFWLLFFCSIMLDEVWASNKMLLFDSVQTTSRPGQKTKNKRNSADKSGMRRHQTHSMQLDAI